ncbi:TPA: glycine zipper family protein [Burkholderia cepacia]|uniref:glycine zipper family protein n=1 Tax=Burkholderia cepacia TaxID=292 RepID=UPI001CF3CA09|nr:glycine zipper family protein [Burkholderia cepacia]HDR9764038.1 glycine zipper family protein [Burkholderia cepacia ATCC 25416]MCA8361219.1 glycine zipper family protein [Burkholderia cepacia]HDR9769769.1 glycine zipper family protein [Burkholderia cepacia ATCC 25416]HDR9779757.1 glycine zipper family protein [Burkholderia cepacia ATCC 25416]HDR9785823.1 glycine zipper family protein [Burkholderia cepacia ATCC 25416]
MSEYLYKTPTNQTKESQYDVLGHLMPARMFIFVVVDEPGKDGFLVRRVYSSIEDPFLLKLNLSPIENYREVFPETEGLWSRGGPESKVSVAEHVLEYNKITSYASTSGTYPDGTLRMNGKTVYVDIAKAKRAGAKLVTTEEIVRAIDEYKVNLNSKARREAEHIKQKVMNIDKEILVQPHPRVPPSGVFSQAGLKVSLGIVKYARVVQVIGIGFTAYDLEVATEQSFKTKSMRPIEKEVVRQIGGWGGAVAGAKMGVAAGALVGIETGPGTIITGLIGGIVFGAIGYMGGSAVADQIPNN